MLIPSRTSKALLLSAASAATFLSAALLPATARAATVSLAGLINGAAGDDNDEIDRWRSTSVLKTLDPNLDNVYGTDGYALFAADDVGNASAGIVEVANPFTYVNGTRRTVSSVPSYLSFSMVSPPQTGVASSYGYKQVDDPSLAPGATVGNLESGAFLVNASIGTEVSLFDVVIGSGAPAAGLRLGLLYGNTDAYNGTFRIEQIVGGTGTVTASQNSAIALQMAFFDITGAAPGDTFRIYAAKSVGSVGNANVLLGAVTIDAIPEPATAILAAFGATALASRRRRARPSLP